MFEVARSRSRMSETTAASTERSLTELSNDHARLELRVSNTEVRLNSCGVIMMTPPEAIVSTRRPGKYCDFAGKPFKAHCVTLLHKNSTFGTTQTVALSRNFSETRNGEKAVCHRLMATSARKPVSDRGHNYRLGEVGVSSVSGFKLWLPRCQTQAGSGWPSCNVPSAILATLQGNHDC